MRRRLAIAGWLAVPFLLAGFHYYGPGERWKDLDDTARILREADAHAAAEQWQEAVEKYGLAMERLPADRVDQIRHARLAKDRARMFIGQLPQAHDDLEAMMEELARDPKAEPAMVDETRREYANSQYYMTWLYRLEGQPETEWKPFIEGARQNFKLLAEGTKDPAATNLLKEDLDSSIRLARMDLNELQALPLPSQ